MKLSTKVILIVSAVLIFSGIVTVCVFCALGGTFDTQGFAEKTYNINGSVSNLKVSLGGTDFLLEPSPEGSAYAVCKEAEHITYTVENIEGTLHITEHDTRKWYEFIGISLSAPTVTLYLPAGEYEELTVNTSSGRIKCWESFSFEKISLAASSGAVSCYASVSKTLTVETTSGQIDIKNAHAETVKIAATSGRVSLSDSEPSLAELSVTSGALHVNNVNCSALIAASSSGRISLDGTVARNTLRATASSGGIYLQRCDAQTVDLKTTSGRVSATLLTGKLYQVQTSSGIAKYPASDSDGGFCYVTTTSGNVNITVAP